MIVLPIKRRFLLLSSSGKLYLEKLYEIDHIRILSIGLELACSGG